MGQLSILGLIAIGGAVGACSRYLVSEFLVTLEKLSGNVWCCGAYLVIQ